jgi:hypothetical protein
MDILHTLEGSQWLSTLDALAGFTQLSIKEEDQEKTAFRCHKGLFHFKRLPFGFRNGPAVCQQVMNNVLAPYLWIFALVYIKNIMIFSITFEDHLKHLDQVFTTIVVNSTKTLKLILIYLDFFQSLYVPVTGHMIPALTLAELLL